MRILQMGTIPYEKGARGETGGVATHVWELSRELAQNGHDVHVFADNNFDQFERTDAGVNLRGISVKEILLAILTLQFCLRDIVHIARIFYPLGIKRVVQMELYYLNTVVVVDRMDPDVIHAHHLEYRYRIAEIVTHEEVPVIASVHSVHSITERSGEQREAFYRHVKSCYQLCDTLVFVSEGIRQDMIDLFGEFEGEEYVIRNPVTLPDANDLDADNESEEDTLLFVGMNIERKGLFTLIDAIAEIESEIEIRLLVIGTDDRSRISSYVEQKGVSSTISVLGRVDDINEYYRKADLFVLPTESESFGLVFLEAFAHGTPVIGTTGVPTDVIPEECDKLGYRVPPNNPNQLSVAIVDAFDRQWDRETIRSYARDFSWESSVQEFEMVYERLLYSNAETNL